MKYLQKLALRAVELRRRTRDRMRRKYFRSDPDIEDAQQSAYVKLLEYGHSDHPTIDDVDGFVLQVVSNQVVQDVRAEALSNLSPWGPEAEAVADPRGTPEDVLSTRQLARVVLKAARTLSKPHRRVIWLNKFVGLTIRQIAERDGVPERRVKSEIGKAIYRLTERVRRRM